MKKMSIFNRMVHLDTVNVIHNFRNGTYIFIEPQNKLDLNNIPEKTRIVMINKGMIVDEKQDEVKEILEQSLSILHTKDAMVLNIILTSLCNLDCLYCFEKNNGIIEKIPAITESTIKFIESKPIPKILDIKWFGGEPLMNTEAMSNIYEYITKFVKRNHISYSSELTTNGTMLNHCNVNLIKNMHIDRIQITIDGTQDIHDKYRPYKNGNGTFIDILNGINNLVSEWTGELIIRTNISKSNFNYIPNMIDTICNSKFASKAIFAFDRIFHAGSIKQNECFTEEEFSIRQIELINYAKTKLLCTTPLFPKQRSAMYCLAEAEYYGIIESGYNIRKCEQDIGMQISGGKYAENLNNLDCSSNYFNFKCKKCFLLPVCMGGCKRNQVCPIYFYTIDDRLRIYYGNIFNGTGNIG